MCKLRDVMVPLALTWFFNMYKVISSRLFFVLACILFRVNLDFSYVFFVNPVYANMGFLYDLSIYSYSLSWIVYLLAVLITPHLLYKVSDYFIASFLLTVVAPLSSIVGLINNGFFPLLVTVSVFFFFRTFQRTFQSGSILSRVMPVPRVMKLSQGRSLSLALALFSVFVLIGWYFYSGAFRYFNLNLMDVYVFREASSDLARAGLFSYFNGWVYSVFSIFLMSYCLLKKNFVFFCLFFGIQVFFFGVSAHRSVLFFPVLILGIWFYFSRTRAMSVMPLGFSVIVINCLLLYVAFDHVIAGSLFIRRVFFVPAKLTLDYFSFFSVNDLIFWSNSVLERFIDYPYTLTVAKEIGQYNGSGSSANNGFISSGYGHAGLWGVAIYSFVFS
ncbi:MAG: hypothetical protein PF904_16390, partial [Kiritimatiellae bacterium]|nr:hypothetical protein [Kiritimatiellia bacterium]